MALVRLLALSLVVLLSSIVWASATDYTVGDSSGWTNGVDYTNWASGKNFQVGDNLIFKFVTGAHTVTEVTQSDYQSCSATNAITNSNSAPTTVQLTSAGTHYFICGVPGHCSSGQKLAVTVGGSSSNSTGGITPPTTGGTTTPTTGGTTTPTDSGYYYNSARLVPVGSSSEILAGVMLMFGLFWA